MEEWLYSGLRVGNRCTTHTSWFTVLKVFNPIYVKVYLYGIFVHKSRSSKCSKETTSLGKPGCKLDSIEASGWFVRSLAVNKCHCLSRSKEIANKTSKAVVLWLSLTGGEILLPWISLVKSRACYLPVWWMQSKKSSNIGRLEPYFLP